MVNPATTPDWFGDGDPEQGAPGPTVRPVELSVQTEQQIAALRRSIAALETQAGAIARDLKSEKAKLRRVLLDHRQPLDKGLE